MDVSDGPGKKMAVFAFCFVVSLAVDPYLRVLFELERSHGAGAVNCESLGLGMSHCLGIGRQLAAARWRVGLARTLITVRQRVLSCGDHGVVSLNWLKDRWIWTLVSDVVMIDVRVRDRELN